MVIVTIYDDLQCGDCGRFNAMLEESLLPKYRGRVEFVHRNFPLPKHNWAREAAKIAAGMPEIEAEIARMQNHTLATVYRLIRSGSLTPDAALSYWMEMHSYDKLLRGFEKKVSVAEQITETRRLSDGQEG